MAYNIWTVPKLKAELVTRGAVTTGRKADLVDRLTAYDRNQDFQQPPVVIPEASDVEWPKAGYKELIPDHQLVFAKVTREQIDGYFLYRMAGDKQLNGDLKALQKGQALLDASKVMACSVLVIGDGIYLSGIVGAAMKKQVSYNYKIKLEKQSGGPVNSKCECPAGKGPHATCKHIAAVLLMAQCFSEKGDILVEKTCTQGLQTFHQPRSYYRGAPVKIENLPFKRKPVNDILDDPRPDKYRKMEGYTDFVRNAMVNYCANTSEDLTLRYIFPRADLQAAQQDHDYLPFMYTEYWVDQELKCTAEEAKCIERQTRGQSENKVWYNERQWRITASRFGEISRITSRRNVKKLCETIIKPQNINTPAILHGKMYEKKALVKFEEREQLKCNKCGLFVLPTIPFLGATPDAVINGECIVEVKCPYGGKNEKIIPGEHFKFLCFERNGNVALKKSCSYYDQIQGQLFLSERNFCYFVVYTFVDLFVQKIEIDKDYCLGSLVPKLELFYSKHLRPYIASTL